jgi:transposase-like protein
MYQVDVSPDLVSRVTDAVPEELAEFQSRPLDRGALTKDLRMIYTAVDEQAAEGAMDQFEQGWSARYPSIVKLWRTHWVQFVPFLAFPPEVRRVVYTMNLIESMNARLRKVTAR